MATQLPLPVTHLRPTGASRAPSYARRHPEETVLYQVVREQLETFLCRARERDRPLPRFVERELRGYLECGILAHGFVRVHCDACGCDRLVAFSCKGRGFCPSCGGRRMADTAAHLVDRVLPEVAIRQWVLSVPFELDVLECPRCSGRCEVFAVITEPQVIRPFLACVGLSTRAPPIAPARPAPQPELEF